MFSEPAFLMFSNELALVLTMINAGSRTRYLPFCSHLCSTIQQKQHRLRYWPAGRSSCIANGVNYTKSQTNAYEYRVRGRLATNFSREELWGKLKDATL